MVRLRWSDVALTEDPVPKESVWGQHLNFVNVQIAVAVVARIIEHNTLSERVLYADSYAKDRGESDDRRSDFSDDHGSQWKSSTRRHRCATSRRGTP